MITVDTNVYISAIEYGGKPYELLERAIAGEFDVASSLPILEEVLRILRDKFKRSDGDVAEAEAWIRGLAGFYMPTRTVNVISEDPDDNRILECAVASGSDVIVTGDRDLLRRGQYEGIKILTPARFLGLRRER